MLRESVHRQARQLTLDHRWKEMKETGGWSILQHERFYTRELRVPHSDSPTSIFALSLTAGAEFSLRRTSSNSAATWYHGNMYSYEHVPPHYVELDSGASYSLTVTYHHDIRIAGDVAAVGDDGVPRSKWKLEVKHVEDDRAVVEPERSVVPSVLRGWTMGSVVGVEVRNPSRSAVEIAGVYASNQLVRSLSLGRDCGADAYPDSSPSRSTEPSWPHSRLASSPVISISSPKSPPFTM